MVERSCVLGTSPPVWSEWESLFVIYIVMVAIRTT